jgi:pyruvate, orthophosphate dikinase
VIKSQALEVNLASYHVDVAIDKKYAPIQTVMAQYYGLTEGLTVFLKELSHPYRNWQFIVEEARGYCLDYFHLLQKHALGPEAAALFVGIFIDAMASAGDPAVRDDAVDNLLLYLDKTIKEAGDALETFWPVLEQSFDRIYQCNAQHFFLFVKSYYHISRLGKALQSATGNFKPDYSAFNRLFVKYRNTTYAYWIKQDDPKKWFLKEIEDNVPDIDFLPLFTNISHKTITSYRAKLNRIGKSNDLAGIKMLRQLTALPGYNEIVTTYRAMPQKLFEAGKKSGQGNNWKVIFLFHINKISGLSMIHEDALRDINRTLSWLIANENHRYIDRLTTKTFSILKTQTAEYPTTALNCVLNMGKGIYKTDNYELVKHFVDEVIELGFQTPMVGGVGNDWQVKVNSAHIQNIRTWLALIELSPKWSTKLTSNLIIHLALFGIFIKDTDLFPRDITRFLNSPIEPIYNLTKQLMRLFPAYFNTIGAEGQLRDISTQIDELTQRKDVLIHFLRKQSHVESNNHILRFMEAVIHFWQTRQKEVLKPFVPPNIYSQIRRQGKFVEGVNGIMTALKDHGINQPTDLIGRKAAELESIIDAVADVNPKDHTRIKLMVAFYKLLHQKYRLGFDEIESHIAQLTSEALPPLDLLKKALAESQSKEKIFLLLEYLEHLKKLILSDQNFEAKEDIYKKRHFTVDIPSMYGSYHELKFDALGLTFRLEALVNVLFEELISNIDLSLITKAVFYQIYDLLMLFNKALKLDGLASVQIDSQLDLLAHSVAVKAFTITQYIDIIKGFANAVKNIINDNFHNVHGENLTLVLGRPSATQILPKYFSNEKLADNERNSYRVPEIFFRDRIALSLGLQQLDLFLSRILNTLYHQSEELPTDKLRQLLLYDPHTAMTSIDNPVSKVANLVYLGSKGFNLVKLKDFGLPVPPGFIITTEVFRFWDIINSYYPARHNFREQLSHHIQALEKTSGKLYGNPKNPLLLSVRSGSSISQPGMMATFLNVGVNEQIAESLAEKTKNPWFAWDNYRRYLQCDGMSFGLERNDFDAIISEFKKKLGLPFKKDFSGKQMKTVALSYKKLILDAGISIEEDPIVQLERAIKRVLLSWDSDKARTYRKIMGISDDWGTAVTVQQMVYGNLSPESGSGVFFTHNPRWSEDNLRLWGDFTVSNQGEDVVSGLVQTLPISINQQEIEMRDTDITLESHYPEIYEALKSWGKDLVYNKGWSPQEMEFTFEGKARKDLHLLQARDMSMREHKNVVTFDHRQILEGSVLGNGIGVSGGAMSGRLVFTLDEIDSWRDKEPGAALILARSDTVPDDIREIFAADGLLTARGGLTSHAAVVAHRLGKTCVVGCGDMVCDEKEKLVNFQKLRLRSGDHISIDGRKGVVYQGAIDIAEAGPKV